MPTPSTEVGYNASVLDVIMQQRRHRDEQQTDTEVHTPVPSILTRRYSVFFKPLTTEKAISVRQITGEAVGKLVNIRGIVTRVSDVKPFIAVCAYSCDQCG